MRTYAYSLPNILFETDDKTGNQVLGMELGKKIYNNVLADSSNIAINHP